MVIMQRVKNVFLLPTRATEGLMRSIFALLQIGLSGPDHTTLSRRGKTLKIGLPKKGSGHLDVVMDSTGLKICGEGEWKVRTHGKSKRRTWRKLHLGVDPDSGEIQAAALTENSISDDTMAEPLLQQIERPIDRFAADGSYDKRKVYNGLNQYAPNAQILIPPRKNARIWQHGNSKSERLKREDICYFASRTQQGSGGAAAQKRKLKSCPPLSWKAMGTFCLLLDLCTKA